jgi:hypothetical protein
MEAAFIGSATSVANSPRKFPEELFSDNLDSQGMILHTGGAIVADNKPAIIVGKDFGAAV